MYVLYFKFVLLLSPGEHCTHILCEHCWCTAAAVVGIVAARLLLKYRGRVSLYASLSCPSQHPPKCTFFLEIIYVFVPTSQIDRNLRPHTPKQKKAQDVAIPKGCGLIHDPCCAVAAFVESLRDGGIRQDTAAASTRQQYFKVWGLQCSCWA